MKRYEICFWTDEEMEEYDDCYGEEAFDFQLDHGQQNIVQFGRWIGATDNVKEAYKITTDYARNHHCGCYGDGEIFIYDNEEKKWFN